MEFEVSRISLQRINSVCQFSGLLFAGRWVLSLEVSKSNECKVEFRNNHDVDFICFLKSQMIFILLCIKL